VISWPEKEIEALFPLLSCFVDFLNVPGMNPVLTYVPRTVKSPSGKREAINADRKADKWGPKAKRPRRRADDVGIWSIQCYYTVRGRAERIREQVYGMHIAFLPNIRKIIGYNIYISTHIYVDTYD
jgi:hypothetical protein